MSNSEIPQLPTTVGESVSFEGGSSRQPVTITRLSDTTFEVRYDSDPNYLARLDQEGADSFYLTPAPGVFALGGGVDSWQFFYEHF